MDPLSAAPPPPPNITEPPGQPFIVRLFLAGVYGVGTMLLGAVAWGLVAYFLESIFLFGAILIGGLITVALTSAFQKISIPVALLLFFPAVGMTLLSIMLGDLLFYTLSAMKQLDMSLPEAVVTVLANAFDLLASSDEASSYIFGVIGAILGFFNAVRR